MLELLRISTQILFIVLLLGFTSASPTLNSLLPGLGLDTLLGGSAPQSSSGGPQTNAQITSSVGPYGLDNAQCETQTYQINADSTNTKFVGIDQDQQNQSSITSLIYDFVISQSNFTDTYIDGTFSNSGTFSISGTLCTPKQGAKSNSAIQLLTHGVGFDSSYWDFSVSM